MSFQNASKYYVALAFYVSPESRDNWIHMKKSAIEKTMRTCGIQHLTILSDVKQGPYWTNEFFNSNYTSPKGKRYGNLDNFTDSFTIRFCLFTTGLMLFSLDNQNIQNPYDILC